MRRKIDKKFILYQLMENGLKEFRDIKKLRPFLEFLFEENFIFPVAVWNKELSLGNNFEIIKLNPLMNSDRLTIENYFEGIKSIEEVYEKNKTNSKLDFRVTLIYPGLDNIHNCLLNTSILAVVIREKRMDISYKQSYNLELVISEKENPRQKEGYTNRLLGYTAVVPEISQTHLEEACSRFVGPNKEYKRIQI